VSFSGALDNLIAEKDLAGLKTVLGGFAKPGELARQYRAQFPRHSKEAASLVAAKLSDLQDDQVLSRLERIFERRHDVISNLAKAWLESSEDLLERLANGEWPFAEQPIPRKEWWQAASVFLEEADAQPRWGWLAQAAIPHHAEEAHYAKERQETEEDDAEEKRGALAQEVEKLSREVQKCKQALHRKRAPNEMARDRITELTQELAATAKRLEHALQAKEALESEFGNAKRQLEGSAKRIEKLEVRIEKIREQLATCQKALKQTQKKLEKESADKPCPETPPQELATPPMQTPFAADNLSGVWIVPYASLAENPTERLLALINLYQAALKDSDDPILAETNWVNLNGKPKGVLLMDADTLLHDMLTVPLKPWLETSLFSYETYLYRLRGLVSELRKSLMEKYSGRK